MKFRIDLEALGPLPKMRTLATSTLILLTVRPISGATPFMTVIPTPLNIVVQL